MSTFARATVQCRCGALLEVDATDSLHAARRPDLRAAILDGSFHCFVCLTCNAVSQLEKVFAYTDFSRRQWFTVVPPTHLDRRSEWLVLAERSFHAVFVERAAPMVTTWAPQFTRRVIFGLASLREKLLAFEAGLDDRRIEQIKLSLVEAGRVLYAEGGYCHLTQVTHDALVFDWAVPGQPVPSREVVVRGPAGAPDATLPFAATLFTTPIVDMRTLFVPERAPARRA